ncbi:peroxiredoxin [Pseudodesulfovibrio sp.]|uniref:peroxiredoxin n=1 Tax=Pseudodesulfovibrio sp. TaxID=2035812 RepID=UPI003D114337
MKRVPLLVLLVLLLLAPGSRADDMIPYPTGHLKPIDSTLKVKVGDVAPDFELPDLNGDKVRLSDYRGKRSVVLSFVPAAWTPVCSDQWPGYNLALDLIHGLGAEVIGITVDNTPTQAEWAKAMHGLDFPVLSDFWPHGKVAASFGVLRSDGMAERSLFVIDKQGIIRYIDVHDINERPDLGVLVGELEKLGK